MNGDWIEKEALPGRRITGMRELTGGHFQRAVIRIRELLGQESTIGHVRG